MRFDRRRDERKLAARAASIYLVTTMTIKTNLLNLTNTTIIRAYRPLGIGDLPQAWRWGGAPSGPRQKASASDSPLTTSASRRCGLTHSPARPRFAP